MSSSIATDRRRWEADVRRYMSARVLYWIVIGLALCLNFYSVYVLIRLTGDAGMSLGDALDLYNLATEGEPAHSTFSGVQMAILMRMASLRLHLIYVATPVAILVLWHRRIQHEKQLWLHIDAGGTEPRNMPGDNSQPR